jgi:SWI/SNF-related matrix-associated actin-dependent regulator 1 of chromatin subfamily A
LGRDTIDEYLYNLIQTKKGIANGVTGTDEETAENKVSTQDMIFEAAMNIFGNRLK